MISLLIVIALALLVQIAASVLVLAALKHADDRAQRIYAAALVAADCARQAKTTAFEIQDEARAVPAWMRGRS